MNVEERAGENVGPVNVGDLFGDARNANASSAHIRHLTLPLAPNPASLETRVLPARSGERLEASPGINARGL